MCALTRWVELHGSLWFYIFQKCSRSKFVYIGEVGQTLTLGNSYIDIGIFKWTFGHSDWHSNIHNQKILTLCSENFQNASKFSDIHSSLIFIISLRPQVNIRTLLSDTFLVLSNKLKRSPLLCTWKTFKICLSFQSDIIFGIQNKYKSTKPYSGVIIRYSLISF